MKLSGYKGQRLNRRDKEMKLRNKKTGEIGEVGYLANSSGEIIVNHIDDLDEWYTYKSLAELNEEWEDYEEEPKNFWFLDSGGEVEETTYLTDNDKKNLMAFGNYFSSKEEAEKAVEKLKAWKRLKDKGFDIEGWNNHIGDNYYKTGQIVINLNNVKNRDWDEYDNIGEIKEDLDLLFGGEDE